MLRDCDGALRPVGVTFNGNCQRHVSWQPCQGAGSRSSARGWAILMELLLFAGALLLIGCPIALLVLQFQILGRQRETMDLLTKLMADFRRELRESRQDRAEAREPIRATGPTHHSLPPHHQTRPWNRHRSVFLTSDHQLAQPGSLRFPRPRFRHRPQRRNPTSLDPNRPGPQSFPLSRLPRDRRSADPCRFPVSPTASRRPPRTS